MVKKKADQVEVDETVHAAIDVDEMQTDDFSDLFLADGGIPFRVELIRMEPESWQGVRIRGYLGDIDPGTTYGDIKKKHGGGRYCAQKRDANTGRYVAARKFDISPWIPIIDKLDDNHSPGDLSLVDQPKLDVAGVQVPISQVDHIKDLVLWMRAVRTLLPEPPDANTQLLGTLVELVKEKSAPASDPLELLTKLRGAVPEIFEKSVEGSNLYTLLQEAIRQAGPILAGGYRLPRKAKLLKDKPQPTGGIGSGAPEENREGDEPMESSDSALMMMLGEMIKAFRLDPPKDPMRVVAMFDHVFSLTKEQRAQMKEMREVGLDVAENQLVEDFIEDATIREKFSTYYNAVFDLYTDPEREAV